MGCVRSLKSFVEQSTVSQVVPDSERTELEVRAQEAKYAALAAHQKAADDAARAAQQKAAEDAAAASAAQDNAVVADGVEGVTAPAEGIVDTDRPVEASMRHATAGGHHAGPSN